MKRCLHVHAAEFLSSRNCVGAPTAEGRHNSGLMEEYCAVCAEPIQFTAYGPCGHKDACSKCIVRLRVVLEDKRCVICQQEHDSVFVTKNLGDFTPTLPATAFPDLQVVVKQIIGQLARQPSIDHCTGPSSACRVARFGEN